MVEFQTRDQGWERRFFIRESPVAGRGLYAARAYAEGEYMTVYMGEDIGGEGTTEGMAARAQLVALCRADHVMAIKAGMWMGGMR